MQFASAHLKLRPNEVQINMECNQDQTWIGNLSRKMKKTFKIIRNDVRFRDSLEVHFFSHFFEDFSFGKERERERKQIVTDSLLRCIGSIEYRSEFSFTSWVERRVREKERVRESYQSIHFLLPFLPLCLFSWSPEQSSINWGIFPPPTILQVVSDPER